MTPAEYNRQIPHPGVYAASWRILLCLPPSQNVRVPGWVMGLPGWGEQSINAGALLCVIRLALDKRINARAGITVREPREGFWELWHDARAIESHHKDRRIIRSFRTKTARSRFKHLLADATDGCELAV